MKNFFLKSHYMIIFLLITVFIVSEAPKLSSAQQLSGDNILRYRIIQCYYNPKAYWQWNCHIDVDYTCNPNHGQVIVGAYFLPYGKELSTGHSYWGNSPVIEDRRRDIVYGTQKINVAVRLAPGINKKQTNQLKIFLYGRNGKVFIEKKFSYQRTWSR